MHESMRRILPSRPFGVWCGGACLALSVAAAAQEDPTPRDDEPAAPQAEPPLPKKDAPKSDIEGAIGPVIVYRPEYQGGARSTTEVTAGMFLRWGRSR
jgi:hypothetical protein